MLKKQRKLRKTRVRAKIAGTAQRPRLTVFRSNKYLYAQAINDEAGITVAHAKGSDSEKVAKEIAKKLTKEKITDVVFDRAGYKYHGKVRMLAENLRKAGVNL